MGCQACRQSEPEANFIIKDPDIKILENQTQGNSGKKEDYNNFLLKFENKLPTLGNYFGADFNTLISPKIQNYITEHPLSISEELLKNSQSYEVKAVEFTNGNVYQGGWSSDLKMEGQGKYFLKEDKVLAEGIWKEGNLIYARVFIIKEDDLFDIYEGTIRYSTFNGKGKQIFSNGMIYEGDFEDGERNGNGKIIFEDGTIYEGQIEKAELKGKGKMTWKNGYEYEGYFKSNKFNGNGTLKGPSGDIYQGEFSNNLFHGKGKYTYNNGNTYEGQFVYGQKKGKGVYKCNNLYEYDGDWDIDLPCGVGKLSNWDKSGIIKSTWRYGNIMEDPIYEKGSNECFENIDLNIIPDKMELSIRDLSNIENTETQSTQYKIGTRASFLDE